MYTWRGKQREAGLGPAGPGGASLKEARDKAAEGRKLIRAGIDPIGEWNKPDAEEIDDGGQAADEYPRSPRVGLSQRQASGAMGNDAHPLLRGHSQDARR